jgi:Trypsin-co-occurring domain 1
MLLLMGDDGTRVVVPVRFGGVDVLVQATPVTVVGSQPTSAATRVVDAYQRAEAAVLGVASSVADTVNRLVEQGKHPRQVQVEFGVSVSVEGDVVVVKGATEATLAVTLTYDVAG